LMAMGLRPSRGEGARANARRRAGIPGLPPPAFAGVVLARAWDLAAGAIPFRLRRAITVRAAITAVTPTAALSVAFRVMAGCVADEPGAIVWTRQGENGRK
jgi:hypothetical protein